jgi:hypothetical protein
MLLSSYIAIVVAYRPSVVRVPVFDSGPRVFFSWQHNVTCFTLAATAALWCTFTFVSPYFGSLGVIGLIPVIVRPPPPPRFITEFRSYFTRAGAAWYWHSRRL